MSWKTIENSVILEKGEEIIAGWKGALESTVKAIETKKGFIRTKRRVVEVAEKEKGALLLTSGRLIWLKRRGVFNYSYHVTIEIPLQDITGISETGFFSRRITVSDRTCEYRFRINSTLSEFRSFVDKALTRRKEELEQMRKRERVQVVLNFSSLKDYMEKGGLVMQTFRCPHCSAPV